MGYTSLVSMKMITTGLFKIVLLYHCLISSLQKSALGERCDSFIVDPNGWSGNFQGRLRIQVPFDISSYKIELETDTSLTNIKFWNGNVFPTMGNSFTVTNPRWFSGKNAGDYLDLGFQMSFAGNRNPAINNIKVNGENLCLGGGSSPISNSASKDGAWIRGKKAEKIQPSNGGSWLRGKKREKIQPSNGGSWLRGKKWEKIQPSNGGSWLRGKKEGKNPAKQ